MTWLTIGAFARASRLSPKALRLYDDLGLLPPARVDPVTGYRRYHPDQLERARLVAWLRRLGMPLDRIGVVCDLGPVDAAAEVAAYWERVEADTSHRRELAAALVDHLAGTSGAESAVPERTTPLTVRYAAQSDHGRVRSSNQDWAFAGSRLFAVADGFGADDAEPASAVAIEALKPLDAAVPAGDVLNALEDAVDQAGTAVREHVGAGSEHSGTTLAAMLWSGSRLALVHVGDSRAYLLRSGELLQVTHDHTVVQSLVDEGRITPDEVAAHPQRSILVRALHGGGASRPDAQLREVLPGDRYLLCSDGLHTVVPAESLHEVLSAVPDPERAVRRLVDLANRQGGPDNITCLVADIVRTDEQP